MVLGTEMDSGHGNLRMNVQGDDRLSSLRDELIHKILSSFDIKQVIETSCLSFRWRYIWTSMPYLNISSEEFSTLPKFAKFVTHVLSRRNNRAEVHSLNFSYRGKPTQVFNMKTILDYAYSHNIQQLNVECSSENVIEFPNSLLTSRSLKRLSLSIPWCCFSYLTLTCELPALATLDLHSVTLRDDNADKCIDVFSKCTNLKNLTITNFNASRSNGFSIVHPLLSNLTIVNTHFNGKVVNVAAPQLKNLTIRDCYAEFVISAPDLASLLYKGLYELNLSTDGFHCLEMADLCVTSPNRESAPHIVSLLQGLYYVKFVTLNLDVVELLSSSERLLLPQPSPFVNLKSLKIYPDYAYFRGKEMKEEPMSNELKSYLLDGSPGCTITIILPEEIIAPKLMAELRVLLAKGKDNTKREKAPLKTYESKTEMMAQFKSCWENLVVQIEQNKKNACDIISKLRDIEELLVKLPASRRAKIQPRFSSLRAEASNTLSKITYYIMICCEESESRSNVILHELATELVEPSA